MFKLLFINFLGNCYMIYNKGVNLSKKYFFRLDYYDLFYI